VDGEHGPLFSGIDLALTAGFHAVQMPGGPGQTTLLMTLAGRFKPTHGTLNVLGDTEPRAIRRHLRDRGLSRIDELEESVSVQTVLAEQRRWLATVVCADPPGSRPVQVDRSVRRHSSAIPRHLHRRIVGPGTVFAADHAGALSNRPILVVGDLEQVRDNARRTIAVERLGALAAQCTVVVGVTNPLGTDAPDHELHTITAS